MDPRDRWLYAWAVGYAAAGAASLLIPLYAIDLVPPERAAFVVGLLASTAAFAGVPGALLWGYLAERTGRRRVFVLFALGATAVVMAVVPLVRSAWVLVGANATLWFVLAAAAPVLTLLIVDGAPERDWEPRIALLNTYQGAGWVGGLVLGSVWGPIGGRLVAPSLVTPALFWVGAVAAGGGFLLAWRRLPRETSVTAEAVYGSTRLWTRSARGAGRYVRTVPFATTRLYWGLRQLDLNRIRERFTPALWGYLLAVTVFSAGFGAFWGPLPAYLSIGFPDEQIFWFFLASNAASTLLYTRVGGMSTRRGARALQSGALSARVVLFPAVGIAVLAAAPPIELPVLLGLFALIGATWAMIAVSTTGTVTRLAGTVRGEALGAYTAVAGIGGGIGSILGGWVAGTIGYLPAFAVASGLVLGSLALIGTLRVSG